MANVNEQVSAEKKPPIVRPAVPKASPPPVRPAASPLSAMPRQAPPTPVSPNDANDIFADIKDQPVAPVPEKQNLKEETVVETPQRGFKKVIIMIGSIVIFAGILAGGGYWTYNQFLKPQALSPSLNLNVNLGTNTSAVETVETTQTITEQTTTIAEPVILDSDNDGLTDVEEEKLGTDYLNPDTDGDILFDGEEVNVYKTNPLKKDTDGDGYEDGAEVKAGYDPAGPGKLIKIPAGQ